MVITDINGITVALDEKYIIGAQKTCDNEIVVYMRTTSSVKKIVIPIANVDIDDVIAEIEGEFSPVPT